MEPGANEGIQPTTIGDRPVLYISIIISYIYIYYIIMIRYAVYKSITMPNQDLDPEEQHLHPFPVRDPF